MARAKLITSYFSRTCVDALLLQALWYGRRFEGSLVLQCPLASSPAVHGVHPRRNCPAALFFHANIFAVRFHRKVLSTSALGT